MTEESITIKMPDTSSLVTRTSGVTEQAAALEVKSQANLNEAGRLLTDVVKPLRQEIADTFDPIIHHVHKAHKEALSKKKKYDQPLADAERVLKNKMGEYHRLAEDKRRKEEERLRKEAEKKAEEKREREVKKLEKQGKIEEAVELLDEPVAPVPPPVLPEVKMPKGVSKPRTVWKFRVKDETKVPRKFLKPDEVKIGKLVRALGKEADIPGVEIYPETSVAAGGRS